MITFKTNYGSFSVELDNEKAPITSKNFLDYVNSGFYNGTIFHRVINGFMIQGGGFNEDMSQKETKAPIENRRVVRGRTRVSRCGVTDGPDTVEYLLLRPRPR